MPSMPSVFQAGSRAVVRLAGNDSTVRVRRYAEVIDNVTRTSERVLKFGPADVPGWIFENAGRRSEGAGRSLQIASGASAEFDAQPDLGSNWTVEDGGREIPLSDGITGVRPDGVTVAYWTARLQEAGPGAGEGAG